MTRVGPKMHNGIYTIKSAETGDHRTFKIHTQGKKAEFAPGRRVVSLFTGTDNTSDDHYTGFAFIDDNGIAVWTEKQGEGLWTTYADMIWTLALDGAFSAWADKGYTIMSEGRCIRCDRVLSTPESILAGIGPICAGL